MKFSSPLQSATLIKRYKRFLADVITPDGKMLTLHCANTGAMTGCATPGDRVWYSTSTSAKRKYPHTWELTETQQGEWICVNTLRANQLVKEAIEKRQISELLGYPTILSEVRYGAENSRIDLLLQAENKSDCYIEIKSATLLEDLCGYFPDAPTKRGQKHIRELLYIVEKKQRAVLFFTALHTGIHELTSAQHIDPHYAELLTQAQRSGVEILCYGATISSMEIELTAPLPFRG